MDMCAVTTRLREMGVILIFLKEQLTFNAGISNPMQELQLHMMSAFSQCIFRHDRSLIRMEHRSVISIPFDHSRR